MYFVLSMNDSWDTIHRAVKCHACGHCADGDDAGKFIHLLDTLATNDRWNGSVSFSKIVIQHQ